jgi:hypothetical protein
MLRDNHRENPDCAMRDPGCGDHITTTLVPTFTRS